MADHIPTKSVVTVKEMAALVGLSRARFYQLVAAGVFPAPVYSVSNHRPMYVESLQEVCLEVRRRGLGINGKPVLFYGKGHRPQRQSKLPRKGKQNPTTKGRYDDLRSSLRALGLTSTTEEQVETALKTLFPNGFDGVDQGQIIRAVFLHLRQQSGAG